jgi:hypothetical protein
MAFLAQGGGLSEGTTAERVRKTMPSWYMTEPDVMVQKRPAQESATRPPMSGVRLAVPLKLVMMLEASTSGRCSWRVRYEIRFELNPTLAIRSQKSFAVVVQRHGGKCYPYASMFMVIPLYYDSKY